MRMTRVLASMAVVAWTALSAMPPVIAAEGPSPRTNVSAADQAPLATATAAVLYDQTDSPGGDAIASQDFEPTQDSQDSQAADDFTIPEGQSWTINGVDVGGVYFPACSVPAGSATAVNVFFYADSAGTPGALLASRMGLAPTGGPSFTLSFPNVTFVPGTYWLSVQAVQDCSTSGQWFWADRSVQSGNPSKWQNPGDGFATGCTTWQTSTSCATAGPDLLFRLNGDVYGCKGFYATGVGQRSPSRTAYNLVRGTSANDRVVGTNAPDVLMGLSGNDKLIGLGAGDLLCGGSGNDKIKGGGGGDVLLGQGGNDKLIGQGGKDFHVGGPGRDTCKGGPGNDGGKGCEIIRDPGDA